MKSLYILKVKTVINVKNYCPIVRVPSFLVLVVPHVSRVEFNMAAQEKLRNHAKSARNLSSARRLTSRWVQLGLAGLEKRSTRLEKGFTRLTQGSQDPHVEQNIEKRVVINTRVGLKLQNSRCNLLSTYLASSASLSLILPKRSQGKCEHLSVDIW